MPDFDSGSRHSHRQNTVLFALLRSMRHRLIVAISSYLPAFFPHTDPAQMAYISKYKDKWRVQIERNGSRTSKVFDTKREAQTWAVEQESQAKRLRSSSGMTFADAVLKYKTDVSSQKTGGVWEVRRLDAMLTMPMFANMALADIDSPHIAQWRDMRVKAVSGSTVVREANLLRNVFNVARLEWRKIDRNPFEGVKLPRENDARVTVWPWQLIKRVLRAKRSGKTAEVQAAFHIALRTGMRLGEVVRAPDNFDKRASVVRIKTKTESAAVIPIGRIAAKLLDRPAFIVGANEASTLFTTLCKELLISGLTFHDSRATALTHLARKVDVLTLAKISRHRNLNLLMNTYFRPSASDIAAKI